MGLNPPHPFCRMPMKWKYILVPSHTNQALTVAFVAATTFDELLHSVHCQKHILGRYASKLVLGSHNTLLTYKTICFRKNLPNL